MEEPNATAQAADDPVYRFVWVERQAPLLGGQWMVFGSDGTPQPIVLADVVAAYRVGEADGDPLPVHVAATFAVITAAGELEDELFPDPTARLRSALAPVDSEAPEVDPASTEGETVRRGAEALEKLAADLGELIEEQLDGGSLANLPPESTRALCQVTQTAWRLRRLIEPHGPLYL